MLERNSRKALFKYLLRNSLRWSWWILPCTAYGYFAQHFPCFISRTIDEELTMGFGSILLSQFMFQTSEVTNTMIYGDRHTTISILSRDWRRASIYPLSITLLYPVLLLISSTCLRRFLFLIRYAGCLRGLQFLWSWHQAVLSLGQGHEHATNANEYYSRGLLIPASEEHNKAAEAFQACVDQSSNEHVSLFRMSTCLKLEK